MTRSARTIALALLSLVLGAGTAFAKPIRVRGHAELYGQARFVEGGILELSGQLTDDIGAPLPEAFIDVSSRGGGPNVSQAAACPDFTARARRVDDDLQVETNQGGEFCLRWSEAPDTGKFVLRFGGDTLHASVRFEAGFNRSGSQQMGTRVRFNPRPRWIELDRERVVLTAEVTVRPATARTPRVDLDITLLDGAGKELGKTRTGGDGKARFSLDPALFAPPGSSDLTVRLSPTDKLAAASDTQVVIRRATVTLEVDGEVAPLERGDLGQVAVVLKTAFGTVDGGVVEARYDGRGVGTGPVADGRAVVVYEIDPGDDKLAELELHYLPSSPWWREGKPLEVDVDVQPPSVAVRLMLVFVVILGIAGIIVSWHRSRRLPAIEKRRRPLAPGVHVVTSRRGARGYSGVVVDAHDGRPLAGATVLVRAPSLEGDGALYKCETDSYGTFAFELPARPEGTEIIAESQTHSAERKFLPGGGRFKIALMTRRRAVLRRFVDWARSRGKPFDIDPEPTPGHVKQAARRDERVSAWAAAVEVAAFSNVEVDKAVEDQLREREPR